MKDGATVIVDDDDIDRDTGTGQKRQSIEVMEQSLIADEHRTGFVQSLAKANPRGQHAINTRGTAVGTHMERFLQTRHAILRFTENEAGGEKDRRVVVDMLKDFVEDPPFHQRVSA